MRGSQNTSIYYTIILYIWNGSTDVYRVPTSAKLCRWIRSTCNCICVTHRASRAVFLLFSYKRVSSAENFRHSHTDISSSYLPFRLECQHSGRNSGQELESGIVCRFGSDPITQTQKTFKHLIKSDDDRTATTTLLMIVDKSLRELDTIALPGYHSVSVCQCSII